jgi:hypothetical protein
LQGSDKLFFAPVDEMKTRHLKILPVSDGAAYSSKWAGKQAVPMATRKTTFEVVKLAEIAPLFKDAEVLGEAEETGLKTTQQPAKILSVSHDRSLAATREMLFTNVGFQVSTAFTVDQAIQLCADRKFELIVIGHSIPIESRTLLIKELRARCTTPLLALQRPGEGQVTGVDYAFDSTQSPGQLLKTVVNILRPHGRTGHGTSANQ